MFIRIKISVFNKVWRKNKKKIITFWRGRTFVFPLHAQTVSRSLMHWLINPNKPFLFKTNSDTENNETIYFETWRPGRPGPKTAKKHTSTKPKQAGKIKQQKNTTKKKDKSNSGDAKFVKQASKKKSKKSSKTNKIDFETDGSPDEKMLNKKELEKTKDEIPGKNKNRKRNAKITTQKNQKEFGGTENQKTSGSANTSDLLIISKDKKKGSKAKKTDISKFCSFYSIKYQ